MPTGAAGQPWWSDLEPNLAERVLYQSEVAFGVLGIPGSCCVLVVYFFVSAWICVGSVHS